MALLLNFLSPWKWFSATNVSSIATPVASSCCSGGWVTSIIQYGIVGFVFGVPLVYMLGQIFPPVSYYVRLSVYYTQMLGTSFFIVLLWPFMFDKEDPNDLPRWVFYEMFGAKKFLGLDVQVRGKEHLDALPGPAVIVCNHQSSIDLIPTFDTIPKRTGIMVKKELQYVGTFGLAVKLSSGVFVDRLNRERARQTLQKLADKLRDENMKIWVFPEGTRNKKEGILPFKKGAFHLALQAHVPIVPVVFSSYSSFYQRERKIFRPGTIIVSVLPPIKTNDYTVETVGQLTDAAHDAMVLEFGKISTEVNQMNRPVG